MRPAAHKLGAFWALRKRTLGARAPSAPRFRGAVRALSTTCRGPLFDEDIGKKCEFPGAPNMWATLRN